jgi:predicted RNase H-like HicB family nuclease
MKCHAIHSLAPVPALVAAAGDQAGLWFLEFFAAQIRTPHTRPTRSRCISRPGSRLGYLRQDNLGRRDFGVEFPDLPGCVTAAWPLEEVPFMAVEALAGHVASLIDAGDPVPAPSTYDQLKDDPELAGAVMILVPLVLA